MRNLVFSIVGAVLLVVGLILAPTPIPVGIPIAAIGAFLLLANSRMAVRLTRNLRRRHDWIDNGFLFLERRSQGGIKRTLERSKPRRPRAGD